MSGGANDDILGILWGAIAAVFGMFALVFVLPFKLFRAIPAFANNIDDLSGRFLPQPSELKETQLLHSEVKALRTHSALASLSSYDLYCSIVGDVFERASLQVLPNVDIIEGMLDTTELLLEADGIGTVPQIDWSQPLGLEQGVRLRNHLRVQRRFFGDTEHHFELWTQTMRGVLRLYLEALPESAYVTETEEHLHETSLSAELIDLIQQPAQVIESLIYSFFIDEISNVKLFQDVRARLDSRFDEASSVTPSEAKNLTPNELVRAYVADTPLAPLFAHTIPFSFPEEARFEHCMVVAGTGHGKTQTLQSLIYDDLQRVRNGECSVIVIDSQGDLINTILHLEEFSPSTENSLADRLMLIDPNDIEFPACLNMFAMNSDRIRGYSPVEQEKILNGVIELFEYVFGALLGAELTQKQGVIFRYIARLMLIIPGATIATLVELMEDGKPFKPYMEQLEGTSKKFFETQFFDKGFNATKKQILRRLWGVMSNRTFERMFSQPENKVDMFEAMNSGKIILINTAKDLLKQEGSEIFGRFFISMIAQSALERAVLPVGERLNTFVYIDEAHEYFSGDDSTFEMLLGQARKYKVGFTTAMQTLSQASPRLRASMMSNTSIKLTGGVSDSDARAFGSEMRTDQSFIRDMYKRASRTEFACFIKHTTPSAIKLSVPLGRMESMPIINAVDYDVLIEQNRARYAKPFAEWTDTEDVSPEEEDVIEVPPGGFNNEKPSPEKEQTNTADAAPQAKEAPSPQPQAPKRTPPQQPGRGGTRHKELQENIRSIGHQLGFLSEIEDEVFDSENQARQIDVALRKEGLLIACEISITTKPEHEIANVARSFDAGVQYVFVIAPNPKHRLDIEKMAKAELSEEQFNCTSIVISAEEVEAQLAKIETSPEPKEKVVRGYTVKTHFVETDPEEAKRRRKALIHALLMENN